MIRTHGGSAGGGPTVGCLAQQPARLSAVRLEHCTSIYLLIFPLLGSCPTCAPAQTFRSIHFEASMTIISGRHSGNARPCSLEFAPNGRAQARVPPASCAMLSCCHDRVPFCWGDGHGTYIKALPRGGSHRLGGCEVLLATSSTVPFLTSDTTSGQSIGRLSLVQLASSRRATHDAVQAIGSHRPVRCGSH